ncbi:SDR family oxidoreductase [Mesoterricola silvestris]|uniref:Short-chain dehydrogenase/reductase n=1 Tax=Mesoterricola silvestris TaxID=2927979 RepID=A0AA48GZZ7_9BACT|nr:SDR family oxidoreductase [Mesoterricola silvestris]BDU73498.1 short-chain dehydrogenase/reductase [Mesoterricola silvestris]
MRRWVLITGCSTGIGRALVGACRKEGWSVVATARNLESLADLPGGEDLVRLSLDVTDPASLAAAVEACRPLGLVGLINNAGYGQMGPLELLRPEELRAQFETNVVGLHAATCAFLPLIRAAAAPGEGRIVQVASILGRMSVPMAGAYTASKHAVVALAETLRLEVAPAVKVILVEPGAVRSEFRETLARALGDLPGRIRGTPFAPAMQAYLDRQRTHAAVQGLSAEACAARIAGALSRANPPRRILIGRDAFWASLGKALLPGPAWDCAVRKAFGLS